MAGGGAKGAGGDGGAGDGGDGSGDGGDGAGDGASGGGDELMTVADSNGGGGLTVAPRLLSQLAWSLPIASISAAQPTVAIKPSRPIASKQSTRRMSS